MKRLPSLGVIVSAGMIASACTVGPDYVRPAIPLPATYREAKGWAPAQPADRAARGPWWQMFHDPYLNRLEERAIGANQNVIAAEAHYRQALAVVDQNVASLFPVIGARTYTRRLANPAIGVPLSPQTFRSVAVSASWVPDFWGGVRRGIEAARANAESSSDAVGAAVLSLQTTLAMDYFALRVADEQQRLLDDIARADERALLRTENRYRGGVAARTDVALAQAVADGARAQAVDVVILRAQMEHAIAVLIGKAPSGLAIPRRRFTLAPPPVPLEVPASLIQRRPDVAGAERLAAAANAQIGVAQAARFPTVTLLAIGGYRANSTVNLFSAPARYWALGPNLAQIIFDGGALLAIKHEAVANYDAAAATYRQSVLTALQNVEDALVAVRVLRQEAEVEKAAVDSAADALRSTVNQYHGGTVSDLNVVLAQTTELSDRVTALNVRGRQLAASVQLIAALGGDWNQPGTPVARPAGGTK